MTIFILFSLYLLIFNISFIYCIYIKIEINLFIDLNLTKAYYQNYECGGSLKIDQNNRQINDSRYPPCISFEHALLRAKFFFEDPKRDEKTSYINVSLKLVLLDSVDWNSKVIKSTIGISPFRYYCLLEIYVLNKPNQFITIDGSDSNYSFLDYQGLELGPPYCDPSQSTRVKLSNIRFINWGDIPILLIKNNEVSHIRQPINIELNSIVTYKSNLFLISDHYLNNSPINIIVSNCTFSNVFISLKPFIISNNYILINDIRLNIISLNNNIPFFSISIFRDTLINGLFLNNYNFSSSSSFSSLSSLIYINSFNEKNKKDFITFSNFHFYNSYLNILLLLDSIDNFNFNLKIENISIDSTNYLNEIKINLLNEKLYNNQINFNGIEISNEINCKTIINCNNSYLNFDNITSQSMLNDKKIKVIGSNNTLEFYTILRNSKILDRNCINCILLYNNSIKNDSSQISKRKFKINIILIIPILVGGIIGISLIIICVLFRKRIKEKYSKKSETSIDKGVPGNSNHRNNENNNFENDTENTEGEILSVQI